MSATSNKQRGFTLPELIVVVLVMGLLMGVVLGPLSDIYTANTTSVGIATQDTDTRVALRQIESEITNSNGFLNTATVPAPTGSIATPTSWDYRYNDASRPNNMVLIVNSRATDATGNMLVFTQNAGSCDAATADPMQKLLVYFVQRDPRTNQYNLYRRTIVNPGGFTACDPPLQKTSCTVGVADPVCQGTDAVLVYNVTGFQVQFFANPTDTGTVTGAAIRTARTVKISLTTQQQIDGVPKDNTASIRISTLFQP